VYSQFSGLSAELETDDTGWVTAEYAMLPKSSKTRITREGARPKGRTAEIQRLIGRSIRAITDFEALGSRVVNIDCDVIQADGGTRTAAVTGAMVAFWEACYLMRSAGVVNRWPIREKVAGVSVGRVAGTGLLDLCYAEDSMAEVDMNVVMTETGKLVEVQGPLKANPSAAVSSTRCSAWPKLVSGAWSSSRRSFEGISRPLNPLHRGGQVL